MSDSRSEIPYTALDMSASLNNTVPDDKITILTISQKPRLNTPLLVGFASSMFQTSGKLCGDSNWTAAIAKGTVPDVGNATEHWNKFEEDLALMARTGANTYRFSIEWSQIEPQQGVYNELAIVRYKKMLAACKQYQMEPMVTLYHFVEPLWFTRLGSFEKQENIQHFIRYAEKLFNALQEHVGLWCTINEPAVQAFSGYLYGQFPPHEHNLQKTIDFLTHLLQAHVGVYHKLKTLPGGADAQIGLVHNSLKFLPRYWWEPIEFMTTRFLTTISNDIVLTFLKTGHIDYSLLRVASKHYNDPAAIGAVDFLGLNYYARPVIGFNKENFFGPTCFPGQEMGDMYLPLDPAGFAAAIDEFASFGKPVYVTETGVADKKDELRHKFFKQYLAVIDQKREAGVDLRGLYLWTFTDNYEWNEGYTKCFGLFDKDRHKRQSAGIFETFIKQKQDENAVGSVVSEAHRIG